MDRIYGYAINEYLYQRPVRIVQGVTFHGVGQVIKQQFRQSVAFGPPGRWMRESALSHCDFGRMLEALSILLETQAAKP